MAANSLWREPQPRGSVWRAGATAPELDEVRAIDVEMAELANQRAVLANRRMRIINRACHREEYRRKTCAASEKVVDSLAPGG